ncbi:MAG: hypothetical protein IPM35_36165 [Myxococcales bacterium]|nr:hypothetical protein [Myxococcales bacterium]
MTALTFDTGALIALERRRQRMRAIFKTARVDGIPILVPSVCVAEWWRGRTDVRETILQSVIVVHTEELLVKLAGEALGKFPSATCVDALVMATAATYGGVVFTSDIEDLFVLQRAFPSVRVLGI